MSKKKFLRSQLSFGKKTRTVYSPIWIKNQGFQTMFDGRPRDGIVTGLRAHSLHDTQRNGDYVKRVFGAGGLP